MLGIEIDGIDQASRRFQMRLMFVLIASMTLLDYLHPSASLPSA